MSVKQSEVLNKIPTSGSPELKELLQEIADDAAKRRQNDKVQHPYRAFELIKKHRLGALRLPVELGGAGATFKKALIF